MPHLKETGLVPGCEESEFTKKLTEEYCKRRFTLGAYSVSIHEKKQFIYVQIDETGIVAKVGVFRFF